MSYSAPAPVVVYIAPAASYVTPEPVEKDMAPALAVDAVPTPVVEYIAQPCIKAKVIGPAPAAHAVYAAPAPIVEGIASTRSVLRCTCICIGRCAEGARSISTPSWSTLRLRRECARYQHSVVNWIALAPRVCAAPAFRLGASPSSQMSLVDCGGIRYFLFCGAAGYQGGFHSPTIEGAVNLDRPAVWFQTLAVPCTGCDENQSCT